MKKTEKLKNIEFLRFIFVLILIYGHLFLITSLLPNIPLYHYNATHYRKAALVVDFFFILSGFFFKYTINTELDIFDFLKKKFTRLWAVVAFAVIGYWSMEMFNITSYDANIYDGIFSFFLMDNIGITLHHCGPSWYVSVLVLVSLFYFCMYKVLGEKITNLIIGILVWFSYTFTINTDFGAISQTIMVQNNFICMGLLRGIGGIGIGVFLHYAYDKYKDSMTYNNKLFYTLAECGLLGWCVYAMISSTERIHNSMICVMAFAVLILLFLIKKGYLSQITDNNLSVVLGKYTYSVFLTHIIIIFLLSGTIWNHSNTFIQEYPSLTLGLIYLMAFVAGFITYHTIEKPDNKLFKKLGFMRYYLAVFTMILTISGTGSYFYTHRPIKADKIYSFNKIHHNIKTAGISGLEQWGRWSDGKEVILSFYSPLKNDNIVKFNVIPFLNETIRERKIEIYSDTKLLAVWTYVLGENAPQTIVNVPKECIKKNGKVRLTFNISDPISPKELGESNDSRKLGIGFVDMKISEAK